MTQDRIVIDGNTHKFYSQDTDQLLYEVQYKKDANNIEQPVHVTAYDHEQKTITTYPCAGDTTIIDGEFKTVAMDNPETILTLQNFVAGVEVGEQMEIKDGIKYIYTTDDKGQKQGLEVIYDTQENLVTANYSYKDNVRVGDQQELDEDGNWTTYTCNKHGRIDGQLLKTSPNEIVLESVTYVDGKKNGPYEYRDANNQVIEKGTYIPRSERHISTGSYTDYTGRREVLGKKPIDVKMPSGATELRDVRMLEIYDQNGGHLPDYGMVDAETGRILSIQQRNGLQFAGGLDNVCTLTTVADDVSTLVPAANKHGITMTFHGNGDDITVDAREGFINNKPRYIWWTKLFTNAREMGPEICAAIKERGMDPKKVLELLRS